MSERGGERESEEQGGEGKRERKGEDAEFSLRLTTLLYVFFEQTVVMLLF